MYRTLLVPLDGSEFSEEALPLAKVLASKLGAELHLVHVVRPALDVDLKMPQDDLAWQDRVRTGADEYLNRLARAMEADGVSTLTAVLEGTVVAALEEYIEEQDVDLVVLTSHGAGGARRWWLGSVADRLLSTITVDVLLVPPWDDTEDRASAVSRFQRILVPLDGSGMAEEALSRARDIAGRFSASIAIVRVIPKPLELTSIYGVQGVEILGEGHRARLEEAETYLASLVERSDFDEVEGHVVKSRGEADGIVESARKLETDLLVLSSRGRSGVTRFVLGSVADKVVRSTTRPVLVVRSHGRAGATDQS